MTKDPFNITKEQQAALSPQGLRALDIQCAETTVSDHVDRFWRHLETETVRVLVELKRTIGTDAPDGPLVYWDGASFPDHIAKALVAERGQLLDASRLSHEWMRKHDRLLGFIQKRPEMLKELIAFETNCG